MYLTAIFSDISAHLTSPEFLKSARYLEHPTAFTRQRKLPFPSLVALLLCGMRMRIQAELDQFSPISANKRSSCATSFEQAFAQAGAKLSPTSIPLLNDWVIQRAQHYGGRRAVLMATKQGKIRYGLRPSPLSPCLQSKTRSHEKTSYLVHLSTVADSKISNPPLVNIGSAIIPFGLEFGESEQGCLISSVTIPGTAGHDAGISVTIRGMAKISHPS